MSQLKLEIGNKLLVDMNATERKAFVAKFNKYIDDNFTRIGKGDLMTKGKKPKKVSGAKQIGVFTKLYLQGKI